MTTVRPLRSAAIALALLLVGVTIGASPARGAEPASPELSPWWHLNSVTAPTNLPSTPPTQEVQEVTVEGNEGDFTLWEHVAAENGEVVNAHGEPRQAAFPATAEAGEVQAGLEAIYGAGNVTVTGGPGDATGSEPYVVTFTDALAGPVAPMVALASGAGSVLKANGASGKVTVTEAVKGRADGTIVVTAANLGDLAVTEAATITDRLPPGLTVQGIALFTPAQERNINVRHFCTLPQPTVVECAVPFSRTPSAAFENGRGERLPEGYSAQGPLEAYTSLELDITVNVREGASPGALNRVRIAGGGGQAKVTSTPVELNSAPTPFGLAAFELAPENVAGAPDEGARSHPFQLTTTLMPNRTAESLYPPAFVKDLGFKLPPGLVGDLTAFPQCGESSFREEIQTCSPESQIGAAWTDINRPGVTLSGAESSGWAPVYNLQPLRGEPARFGFVAAGTSVILDTAVRAGADYGITVSTKNISQVPALVASRVTLWGVPGDPSHDLVRLGQGCEHPGVACPVESRHPFLTMPSSCPDPASQPLVSTVEADSWAYPGHPSLTASLSYTFPDEAGEPLGLTGCANEPFEPSLQLTPESRRAASPTGLEATVHIPQAAAEDPEGVAPSDLKDTTVVLPKGISVNPSSANGLGACTEAQIGYKPGTSEPAEFTPGPAECPDASKIGTVEIRTPLLDHPIGSPGGPVGNVGAVYVAEPHENPFGSLLAIYVAVDDPISGTVVKLPGEVVPDPQTGRLTTVFPHTPQQPFEDFHLRFFGGPRAALKTPDTCGTFTAHASFTPWSGTAAVSSDPSFRISEGPGGGGCATSEAAEPNSPAFSAGTEQPLAGQFSPFVLHLSREDGSQPFSRIDTTLPEGLIGRLAGIPYCPDSALAAAAGKSGREEQASASCPAASQIGSVVVGAGAGPQPYYTQGSVYLAGPYKGAPLSLAIVTPAVAGPYDLGTVVVRTALYVDPETAQITAKSDPIPSILQGIPLDVRSIALRVDRPDFTLNPTSCEAMQVTGQETSTQGRTAQLANRFQAAGCAALAFRPKLKIRLKGQTGRIGHPALKAVLTARPGEANIGRAQVNLPHGEFLDQGNLNKTCTRPVLLAGACPASTVYGHARAFTPLLEKPLEGNVYLVGGYGYKLPALVAELDGQIRVLLVGKVDSGRNKGIRSTFEVVPDAPVEKFELSMKGGRRYGLLENSENLCKASKKVRRAIVRFTGQNGKVEEFKPLVANQCGKKHAKRSRKHRRHHGRQG